MTHNFADWAVAAVLSKLGFPAVVPDARAIEFFYSNGAIVMLCQGAHGLWFATARGGGFGYAIECDGDAHFVTPEMLREALDSEVGP